MTPLYHSRPERWPQFTLRGMLVAVALMGVALSWAAYQLSWIRQRHDLLAKNEALLQSTGVGINLWKMHWDDGPYLIGPPGPLRLFGERGVAWIDLVIAEEPRTKETPGEVVVVRRLFPEARISWTFYDKVSAASVQRSRVKNSGIVPDFPIAPSFRKSFAGDKEQSE